MCCGSLMNLADRRKGRWVGAQMRRKEKERKEKKREEDRIERNAPCAVITIVTDAEYDSHP